MRYQPVDIARQFLFVRESTQNHGQRVEAIQRWCGGQPGESYCCYFATMILDICYQGAAPIPRLGACEDVHQMAKQKGWLTETPSVGDLYLFLDQTGHAHHIGIVTTTLPLAGIAGNTSPDGTSSNGDGVHEHQIHSTTFVHYQE